MNVISIGDSIAAGIGDQPIDGRVDAWGGRLARVLDGGRAVNLAVPGARMGMIRSTQVPAAVIAGPSLVLMSAGGNDIVDRRFAVTSFADGLQRCLAAITASQANIVLLTVPDLAGAWPMPGRLRRTFRARIDAVNCLIRESRASHGAVVIDWEEHLHLREADCLHPDRVHLSPLGYERLAGLTRQLLGLPDPTKGHGAPSFQQQPARSLSMRDVVPLVRKSPDIARLVMRGPQVADQEPKTTVR